MRYLAFIGLLIIIVATAASIHRPQSFSEPVAQTKNYINRETGLFAQTVVLLSQSIHELDVCRPASLVSAKSALKKCRLQYKKISFYLDYFYPQAGKLYNGPPKKELEEPFMEFEEPQGLQQIESLLFGAHPENHQRELENLVLILNESSHDLISVYQTIRTDPGQLMESLHLELIRIMSLYITGYDAPFLKSGVQESDMALESVKSVIKFFLPFSNSKDRALLKKIEKAQQFLQLNNSFDAFNRLAFTTDYLLPLEAQLTQFIEENALAISTVANLDYHAINLYMHEVIVNRPVADEKMISLGKMLFSETALSGNGSRSCASCHDPAKYFTDQLPQNISMDGSQKLKRNTQGLLYAAYQSTQFWDGRDSTASQQIHDVLTSKDEMNGSVAAIETRLNSSDNFRAIFRKAFQTANPDDRIGFQQIQTALSAYIRSLGLFNAAFDRFMSGDHNALTKQQQEGFNLFMGKAGCGTCHFAPVFNGSTPPFFNRSEYEVLGVPAPGDAGLKRLDPDLGRYNIYPVDIYRRAFKTPTVRNSAGTFPYMHNGSMKTLRAVVEFYNAGGGLGLGMPVPGQTLPEHRLHLSNSEINALVAFMEALTDE